jgi:hypothetical protein
MKASRLDNKLLVPGGETVNLALDEVLKRLEFLERRIERLEAAAALGRRTATASNADDFAAARTSEQARKGVLPGAIDRHGEMPAQRVPAVAQPSETTARQASSVEPPDAAARRPGSGAAEPRTERLDRVPGRDPAADPFPDLSLLDEKLEPRKGPVEHLQVRAALEDYPRISSRIEQLWGTADCEAYLNSLVIDTRGNRQGFPPAMMEELLYLGRLARALVILAVDGDLWTSFDQVGDRR